MNGILHCVAFCMWLFSHSIASSRFVRAGAGVGTSLHFTTESYFPGRRRILLICSSTVDTLLFDALFSYLWDTLAKAAAGSLLGPNRLNLISPLENDFLSFSFILHIRSHFYTSGASEEATVTVPA